MEEFRGEKKSYKVDEYGQTELIFDELETKPEIQKQRSMSEKIPWKDKVTEVEFRDLMLKYKIGPALWDSVVIDDTDPQNLKVVSVNDMPYKDWDAFYKQIDGPEGHWKDK